MQVLEYSLQLDATVKSETKPKMKHQKAEGIFHFIK